MEKIRMEQLRQRSGPLVIAGPCALESRQQLRCCVRGLQREGINHIRASLWKPRTKPGWEGLGALGLHILLEETLPYGLIPSTEIITPDHARFVVEMLRSYGSSAQMILWLGSRNQNHLHQQEIARILSHAPEGITLMIKNQMWQCEQHWLGIVEHVVAAGFPKERLLLCHRGFAPGRQPNPLSLRNLPDYSMAMTVKETTKCPMLLDPSHIGGSRDNVLKILEESCQYDFNGLLLEVHGDPDKAITDASQQLPLERVPLVLKLLSQNSKEAVRCVV